MPQPNRPLATIFVSSRSDRHASQVISPRTPHSRAGRAEEGLTVELEQLREEDEEEDDSLLISEQQPQPPTSPGTASTVFSPGYRSRGDDHDILGPKQRMCPSALMFAERLVYISGLLMACGMVAIFMNVLKQDDTHGPGRTINYHPYYVFPLTGPQYAHECEKLALFREGEHYWSPPSDGPLDVVHHDRRWMGGPMNVPVCASTVTYQLDGHADFATDLALMAQVAALARERNSTFFIDDTFWNRGKWSDYFEDVRTEYLYPQPGCRRPLSSELVACPRTARHWVVNAHTAKYHLGPRFRETFEDQSAHGTNRRNAIFDHASQSFAHIIRPNAHMAALIRAARQEIASILSLSHNGKRQDPYIAVNMHSGYHWRDHHNATSVALDAYVRATRDTWARFYPASRIPAVSEHSVFPSPPISYVAADSPQALKSFIAAFSQSTAKFSLDLSTNAELRGLAPEHDVEFTREQLVERIRLTRGVLVDLALTSGLWAEEGQVVPGASICAARSNACELAAIGLGWERAFGLDDTEHLGGQVDGAHGRWVPLGAQNTEWKGFQLPLSPALKGFLL